MPAVAPTVSVCIPTYNSAFYLQQAVASVLRQSFADYELVICDDASTDETSAVCASYDDPRIRYRRFDTRGGQAKNWNRCVESATGRYVVLLHADDLLDRRFIERAVTVLDRHSEVGLVHCSVQHIAQDGSPLHVQTLYDEDRVDPGETLWRRLAVDGCVVNPAGVMVRREMYEAAGSFCEQIGWGIDWHMWLRLALATHVGYLAEPLAFYRQHLESGTSRILKEARGSLDELWVVEDVFRHVIGRRPDLAGLRAAAVRGVAHRTWCVAELMCQRGLPQATRTNLRRSVAISPRMALQRRVWMLWLASYLGYSWFELLHRLRRRIFDLIPSPR